MMAQRQLSRRRRADPDEEEFHSDSIFDVLNPDGSSKPPDKAKDADGPTVAELMERLAAQEERFNQLAADRAMADSRIQPQTQTAVTIEQPKLNLEGLPDPVTDAQGYAKALIERSTAYQNAMADYGNKQRAANTPVSKGDPDALWDDFLTQFPEYAEAESQIKFATAEVAQRLAKRGVDVQTFMFTHPDQFFKQITTEFDKTFGAPNEGEDDDLDTNERNVLEQRATRRKAKAQRVEDEGDGDEGRTDGIIGGSENSGVRQGRPSPKGGLIEDLQAIQRKTGYF